MPVRTKVSPANWVERCFFSAVITTPASCEVSPQLDDPAEHDTAESYIDYLALLGFASDAHAAAVAVRARCQLLPASTILPQTPNGPVGTVSVRRPESQFGDCA